MAADQTPYLLLLPPPPQPLHRASIAAAYRDTLTNVLTRLSKSGEERNASEQLVIALTGPTLSGASPKHKTIRWSTAQSLLSALYTVIAVICAEHSIASDVGAGRGSIDSRVVLVDHEKGRSYQPDFNGGYPENCTTVYDLPAFATHVYPWKAIFHPSSEAGYELLSAYLKFAEGKQKLLHSQLVAVPGGLSLSTASVDGSSGAASSSGDKTVEGYSTVCLGGTFDHLHPGHKLLLHATALLLKMSDKESPSPSQMIVGISGSELLKNKKYASELQDWPERARNVFSFLVTALGADHSRIAEPSQAGDGANELHLTIPENRLLIRCVEIQDPFGPTITEEKIDAIVVSGETRSGGEAINKRRDESGWKALEVYEVDVLDAEDGSWEEEGGKEARPDKDGFAAKISSTAIRKQRAEAKRS